MNQPVRRRILVRAVDAGRVVGVPVEAEVYGALALHESVSTLRPWTVTHVASGSLIMTFEDKPRGEAFVKGLLALDLNWEFTLPDDCPAANGRAIERLVGRKARGGVSWRPEGRIKAAS